MLFPLKLTSLCTFGEKKGSTLMPGWHKVKASAKTTELSLASRWQILG